MVSLASCICSASIDDKYLTLFNAPPDLITSSPDLEKGETGTLINRKCAICDVNMQLNAKSIHDLYNQPSIEARIAGFATLKLRVLPGCGHLAHAEPHVNERSQEACWPCLQKRTVDMNRAILDAQRRTIERNTRGEPADCRTSCCKILIVCFLFSLIIYPFVV